MNLQILNRIMTEFTVCILLVLPIYRNEKDSWNVDDLYAA